MVDNWAIAVNGFARSAKMQSERFAEFLGVGSLVHLGILYQPTCVGLRYGHNAVSLEAFLDSPASIRPLWPAGRHFHSPLGHRPGGFAYQDSLPAWRVAVPPGPSSLHPPSLKRLAVGRECEPVVHRLRLPASA